MEHEFKDVLQQVMVRPLKKYSATEKQNIIMVSKMIYEQSDNIDHRQARKLLRDLKRKDPSLSIASDYVAHEIGRVRVKGAKEMRAQRSLKDEYRKELFRIVNENTDLDKTYMELVVRHILKGINDLSDHTFVYKMLDELADGTKKKSDKDVIRYIYISLKEVQMKAENLNTHK